MSLENQLMRLSLRQLGELVGLPVEVGAEDRAGFENLLDLPLRLVAREFRTKDALRLFVVRKLEQAEERKNVQRIAAIFDAA